MIAMPALSDRPMVSAAAPSGPIIGAKYSVRTWRVRADNTLIEPLDGLAAGSSTFDADRAISGDCQFNIRRPTSVNALTDCFAVYVDIAPYDRSAAYTYQAGLYRAKPGALDYLVTRNGIIAQGRLDGDDMTAFLSAAQVATPVNVFAGTNIVQAARLVIDGLVLPGGVTLRHYIPDHPALMTETKTYFTGTSRMDIVNDLLNMIGYYHVWADRSGRITSGSYRRWDIITPHTTYRPGNGSAIGATPSTAPVSEPYNVVVVVKDHEDPAERLSAVRRNIDPEHPYSIPRLGYERFRPTVHNSQLTSQEAVDAHADRLIIESSAPSERGALVTRLEPWHDAHELLEIDIPEEFSVPGDDSARLAGRWRVTGYRHDWVRLQTRHDLARTVNLIGTEAA